MKIANIQNTKITSLPKKENVSFKMNYSEFNYFDSFEKYSKIDEKKLKNSLKDENMLYDIFTGKETKFPTEVLNDSSFMKEMFYDVDYMKASNKAFKRIIEDKLQDENLPLDSKDRSELAILHSLFSWQEEMFNDPQNSFEVGLEDLKNKAKNKRHFELFNKPMQPAFCSIFNYGFINKPKTRKKKAEAIVNRAASAAAVEAAATLHYNKIDFEQAGLTFITNKMCIDICKTYQMSGGTTSALLGQVSGAFVGTNLAKIVGKFLPKIWSNLSQAGITYTLHQITGRALIEFCEKNYDNQDLEVLDKAIKAFRIFSHVDATMDTIAEHVNKDNPYADMFKGDDRW